jgi:hypothetical protein
MQQSPSPPPPHSYILLKDTQDGNHHRGKLVEMGENRYTNHLHSWYRKCTNPTKPSADSDEVAPLTDEECRILDAIDTDADRYTVYSTPGKLAWGVGLKVGDTVLAKLPKSRRGSGGRGQEDCYTSAILKWHGKVEEDRERYLFGVQIAVSSLNYRGVFHYFMLQFTHTG